MSQDKIDIKDVTPKVFNPKTHKGQGGDRFNPSKGSTFEKVRHLPETASLWWLVPVDFGLVPWISYGDKAILLDMGNQQFNFSAPHFIRKI